MYSEKVCLFYAFVFTPKFVNSTMFIHFYDFSFLNLLFYFNHPWYIDDYFRLCCGNQFFAVLLFVSFTFGAVYISNVFGLKSVVSKGTSLNKVFSELLCCFQSIDFCTKFVEMYTEKGLFNIRELKKNFLFKVMGS